MLPTRLQHFWICKKKPQSTGQTCRSTTERLWFTVVVAGVELRRDGIFSSRLAATALYTTSPSVAYLRIDLRIHHNSKPSSQLLLCFATLLQSLTAYPSARLDHLTRWLQQVRALYDVLLTVHFHGDLAGAQCSYLLHWSNRHGDQPHSCMPGYTFRLPADAKE